MERRVKKELDRKHTIIWSANFAYAVGLLASDGCLYKDGRHICFVSKDLEQIENYMRCLHIDAKIGVTTSSYKQSKNFRVQISHVTLYDFLISIGITPAKSKTIDKILVPDEYFFDFLRGCFDGDGTFYSYWDKRWRSSHMFYLEFISSSKKHIDWLQGELFEKLSVQGHITSDKTRSTYQLKYAKREALEIIAKMYYTPSIVCLSRKREKIQRALVIEKKQQETYS